MWAKVDDGLHSSPKWAATPLRARGLWVTALSWCMDHLTDGHVPAQMLRVFGATKRDATALVTAGLWDEADAGWAFHDWSDYQPDAASIKAKREAESAGGLRGNHTRWHQNKGIVVPDCEFCEASGTRSGGRGGTRVAPESGGNPPGPEPVPVPTTYVSRPAAARNASDEPPADDPHPQPEMQNVPAVLQAAGLAHHEVRDFLVDLKGTGARSTSALVSSLHRSGKLAGRIAEWRTERDLATEASTRRPSGRRTTDDKVRDGLDLARRLSEGAEVVPIRQIEGA